MLSFVEKRTILETMLRNLQTFIIILRFLHFNFITFILYNLSTITLILGSEQILICFTFAFKHFVHRLSSENKLNKIL